MDGPCNSVNFHFADVNFAHAILLLKALNILTN